MEVAVARVEDVGDGARASCRSAELAAPRAASSADDAVLHDVGGPPIAPNALLRPFQSARSSSSAATRTSARRSRGRRPRRARPPRPSRREPVQLDHQHGARVGRVAAPNAASTAAIVNWSRISSAPGGARRHDGATVCAPDRALEQGEERPHLGRGAAAPDLRDDAERALAADEQAEEVEPVESRACRRARRPRRRAGRSRVRARDSW